MLHRLLWRDDVLVAAASSFVGLGEEGDNRGQMVGLFLREVGQPAGQPWCAAFVHHVAYWAHYDHRGSRSSLVADSFLAAPEGLHDRSARRYCPR